MPSSLNIAAPELQPLYLLRHHLVGFNISGFSMHFDFRKITACSLTHRHSTHFYCTTNVLCCSGTWKNGLFSCCGEIPQNNGHGMGWESSDKAYQSRRGPALAPFVDRGLSWFATHFNYQSREKAFAAIVGLCFGLAIILFFAITLLWA